MLWRLLYFMKMKYYFDGLLEHKKAEGSDKKTLYDYKMKLKLILEPTIGEIDLEDLREIDADKIKIQGLEHGEFGPERGIVVFRQLLRYIKKLGVRLPFDWRDVKLPKNITKEVEVLSPEEWKQLRNCFNLETYDGLRNRALCEVLWCTGMRISEALSLNKSNVDWNGKEAKVVNAKSKEIELIYFTDEALFWLKKYLDIRNEKFEPLFTIAIGRRVTPCTVRNSIKRAVKTAGITKRIHPHIFRSTFCTELLERGTDIKSVQILARHKSERTTLKHYIRVSKQRAKEQHQKALNTPFLTENVPFIVSESVQWAKR